MSFQQEIECLILLQRQLPITVTIMWEEQLYPILPYALQDMLWYDNIVKNHPPEQAKKDSS